MKSRTHIFKTFILTLSLYGVTEFARATDYSQLLGVTDPASGHSTLVQIDPLSGQATTLFSFPLSFSAIGSMTYYPPSGQFVICNGAAETPRLAFVNPQTKAANEIGITGFPSTIGNVQSVAYFPSSNSFVITCGPGGSFVQNHLEIVNAAGQVIQTSSTLPFPDADYVAYNPSTGLLNIVDLNSGPGVQSDSDPFGSSPTFNQVGPNLGTDPNYGDPAFSPNGQLFILYYLNQTLLKLTNQNFVTIGPFNNAGKINGLAFGQIPPIFTSVNVTSGSLIATLAGLSSGQMVILQGSTNLTDWRSIQTNAASGPTLAVTNLFNPAIPAQFFRAIVQ